MTEAVENATPRKGYFRSSLVLALLAFLVAVSAFFARLIYDESPVAYGYALGVFLAVAPLMHVVGITYAALGAVRGAGRLRASLCIMLHVALIGLGVLLGGIALIGASA